VLILEVFFAYNIEVELAAVAMIPLSDEDEDVMG